MRKRRLAFQPALKYSVALMKTVSVAEAARNFSRLLKLVSGGETIAILNRGRLVATINPVRDHAQRQHHLTRLRRQPLLAAARGTRDELY